MTYTEFVEEAARRNIHFQIVDARDKIARLDTPLPVKVDTSTTRDPHPFDLNTIYQALWFYPSDGARPDTLLLGEPAKWYPMKHFTPA